MEILAFFGLDVLTGMELLFAGSALLGGLLFLAWFLLAMIGGVAGDYIDKYVKYRQNRLPNEKAKLQKGLSQLAKQLTPAQKRLMKAR